MVRYPDVNIQFFMEQCAIDVQNIVFGKLSKSIPTHSHGSNCYEIHYVPEGYGKLKANGKTYEICPNTLYVTGPHVEHAQMPFAENPMEEYCVYLKLHHTEYNRKKAPVLTAFSEVPFWFGQDSQQINEIMKKLFWELEQRYTGYHIQAELLLSQLIVCLVRNYEQKKKLSQRKPEQPADTKSLLIEEYFLYEYPSLSLENLADRLGLSTRQTQRLLQEYYGKNFQQKKAEARMSAAAFLLEDKNRSITSIADYLGYSSVEHFSSSFRKFYKMSPREYRKQLLS